MKRLFNYSRRYSWLSAGLFMNSACILPIQAANTKATKPNIVFILADDLGWSDVGYHGGAGGFYETPNLDILSRQGMRLENFYPGGANSAPSRSCIITGMYNTRTKIYTPGGVAKGPSNKMRLLVPNKSDKQIKTIESRTELDPSVISLAEVLHKAGYATARMGKWHLGKDTQGFDESTTDGTDTSGKEYYGDPYATDRITEAALKYIEKHKEDPFFLYVSYFDVHTPMVAKPEIIDKYTKKWETWGDKSRQWNPIYAAKMEQVDTSVGKIYAKLKALNLDENTLFIFASDNGGVGFITDNSPLRGSKGNLYEGGIRTPAFAVWPKVIPVQTKSNTAMAGIDMMPTFAEIADVPLSKEQVTDGTSILPVLKGADIAPRALLWHYPLYLTGSDGKGWKSEQIFPVFGTQELFWRGVPSSAIQKEGWKLIYFYETKTYELYHVVEDVSEKEELSARYPQKSQQLYEELQKMLKNVDADIPSVLNPDFAPDIKGKTDKKNKKRNQKKR